MLALLLTFALSATDVPEPKAADAPELKPAFMVIADGATTREDAEKKLQKYKSDGLPRHDDFPKLKLSSDIKGLKPGFWIIVAGVPRDEEVAKKLAAFIRGWNGGAYYRKVEVADAEDLHLVSIRQSKTHLEKRDDPPPSPEPLVWYVSQYQYCADCERLERGAAGRNPAGAVVIPYTASPRDAPTGTIFADQAIHQDWECGIKGALYGVGLKFQLAEKTVHDFERLDVSCNEPLRGE